MRGVRVLGGLAPYLPVHVDSFVVELSVPEVLPVVRGVVVLWTLLGYLIQLFWPNQRSRYEIEFGDHSEWRLRDSE
jgi:hypothetical protein